MPRYGDACKLLVGAALALAAPASAQVILPAPDSEPLRVTAADDPLVGFLARADRGDAFRATVGKAVAEHPAVAEAIAVQAETAAVRTEVRAALFPRLDFQIQGSRSFAREFGDNEAIVESLQPQGRADAAIVGDQLIYDFGGTRNRIAAASARVLAAEAEVRRVAGDTALRAVASWYDVLTYQTLVDLVATYVARHRAILGDTQTRAAQGVGASGDVARGEAYLADAEALGLRYERQLATARARYREAFGADPAPRLFRAPPPLSTATSYDTALALGRAANPAVQSAEAQVAAAKREVNAARANGRPRVSVGLNATRFEVFDSNDYDVRGTVTLRQSLFAGGAIRARTSQAAARRRQAEFNADRVVGEIERDAGIAWRESELLTRQRVTLESAYIANRRSRDLYVEQFRVARGSLIELVRAEQDFFASAANYLQGSIELDVARYALLVRTGEVLPVFGVTLQAKEL